MHTHMIEREMMPETPTSLITRERLYDGQIIAYTIPDTSRKTIDAWGNSVLEGIRRKHAGRLIYALHDFSSHLNVLTPHVYQWQDRLTHVTGNAPGYVAIILPRTTFARVAKLLIAARPPTLNPNLKIEIFYTRDEALAWLVHLLP